MGQRKSDIFNFLHEPNSQIITINNYQTKIQNLLNFFAQENGILLKDFPDENDMLSRYCYELYKFMQTDLNDENDQCKINHQQPTTNEVISQEKLFIPEIEAHRSDYEALVPSKVLRHMERNY